MHACFVEPRNRMYVKLYRIVVISSIFEKKEIIESGRSTLHKTSTRGDKVFVRSFQTSNYESYKWLAGSSTLKKLFCWPCRLFNCTDKTVWNKKRYDDLGNLCNAISRHEKTKTHMSSCLMNANLWFVKFVFIRKIFIPLHRDPAELKVGSHLAGLARFPYEHKVFFNMK